jgi:hypothetical protein
MVDQVSAKCRPDKSGASGHDNLHATSQNARPGGSTLYPRSFNE